MKHPVEGAKPGSCGKPLGFTFRENAFDTRLCRRADSRVLGIRAHRQSWEPSAGARRYWPTLRRVNAIDRGDWIRTGAQRFPEKPGVRDVANPVGCQFFGHGESPSFLSPNGSLTPSQIKQRYITRCTSFSAAEGSRVQHVRPREGAKLRTR